MTCVTVLVMRAAGAHMHVCLDGQEPPQSLHWGDSGVHVDADHTAGSHADVEIALLDEALAKNLASGWDMPVLPATALLLLPPALKASPRITTGRAAKRPPASTSSVPRCAHRPSKPPASNRALIRRA
jgi:hypothetical protein